MHRFKKHNNEAFSYNIRNVNNASQFVYMCSLTSVFLFKGYT